MKHSVNQIQNRAHNCNFEYDDGNRRNKNKCQKFFERAQPSLSVDAVVVHRNKHHQAEPDEKQYV